jgi:hypothetical protein
MRKRPTVAMPLLNGIILCAAILSGATSTAQAVGELRLPAATRLCAPPMQPSAQGVSDYAFMLAVCMDDYFDHYRRLP